MTYDLKLRPIVDGPECQTRKPSQYTIKTFLKIHQKLYVQYEQE